MEDADKRRFCSKEPCSGKAFPWQLGEDAIVKSKYADNR